MPCNKRRLLRLIRWYTPLEEYFSFVRHVAGFHLTATETAGREAFRLLLKCYLLVPPLQHLRLPLGMCRFLAVVILATCLLPRSMPMLPSCVSLRDSFGRYQADR